MSTIEKDLKTLEKQKQALKSSELIIPLRQFQTNDLALEHQGN